MATFTDINTSYDHTGTSGELVKEIDALNNQLMNLYGCPLGSREAHPTFGLKLHRFIHEPCDRLTAERIRTDLLLATTQWQPRIECNLNSFTVTPLGSRNGFTVTVQYYVPALSLTAGLSFVVRK